MNWIVVKKQLICNYLLIHTLIEMMTEKVHVVESYRKRIPADDQRTLILIKCQLKLLIPSQTSTVSLLNLGNG